jgi:hypothetical protein
MGFDAALDITTRLVAIGCLVSAVELFTVRRQFTEGGPFAAGTAGLFRRRLTMLCLIDRALVWLLAVQAGAGAVLALTGPFSLPGRLALLCLATSLGAVRWRRHTGGDGAEQLAMLVLIAAGLAVLPYPADGRVMMAAVFIAAQVSLAYVTAGIAKLASGIWRDGAALPAIFSTNTHGHPLAAALLANHGGLARAGSWGVIVFECAFPLLFLGPSWLALGFLAVGLAFHAGCALLMGLNSFLWSFPATYPCVFVVAVAVSGWLASFLGH